MSSAMTRVKNAIQALRNGKMIILTDHPDRENEGDIIFPAEIITPEIVNFMIRNCSGIICLSMDDAQFKKLGLTYMVSPHANTSQRGTPFTVSIEARDNITTGVSAQDRATTILAASRASATEHDLVKPGHVFPLHARAGGVLVRQGHTEGALDLVQLAGFQHGAVLCEVMNPDGTMTKGEELTIFAKQHDLVMLSIDDIITYRLSSEDMIADEVTTLLPLEDYGLFQLSVLKEKHTDKEHMVLMSDKKPDSIPLVRIHSACVTGDLFGSKRCDCNKQLHYSLKKISEEGGILIYLNQEGRGIGLFNKIKAYHLQDQGLDSVEANQALNLPIDARDYAIAANILRNKNINHLRLLTNNPRKISGLQKYSIANVEMETLPIFCTKTNSRYLQTKKEKLNHVMNCEFF